MNRLCLVAVILFGLCLLFAPALAGADEDAERFQAGDGVVVDTQTGLMWATQDNGGNIDWYGALGYCRDYRGGGYDDWRLPDIKELATLYQPGQFNRDGYHITDTIRLSGCCPWSSYDTMGGALAFSFKSGKRPAAYLHDTYQMRVLPVRGTRKDVKPGQKEGIFSDRQGKGK